MSTMGVNTKPKMAIKISHMRNLDIGDMQSPDQWLLWKAWPSWANALSSISCQICLARLLISSIIAKDNTKYELDLFHPLFRSKSCTHSAYWKRIYQRFCEHCMWRDVGWRKMSNHSWVLPETTKMEIIHETSNSPRVEKKKKMNIMSNENCWLLRI